MKTTQKEREETKEERDGEKGKKGREKRWKGDEESPFPWNESFIFIFSKLSILIFWMLNQNRRLPQIRDYLIKNRNQSNLKKKKVKSN
jgi:hypothetical protein